jgi:hypothetical protein
MLSSGANVIIWDKMLSSKANVIMASSGASVIIWCYHAMLSSGMITPPFFVFPGNFTHSVYSDSDGLSKQKLHRKNLQRKFFCSVPVENMKKEQIIIFINTIYSTELRWFCHVYLFVYTKSTLNTKKVFQCTESTSAYMENFEI